MSRDHKGYKVYIGGLSHDADEYDVRSFLGNFHTIEW